MDRNKTFTYTDKHGEERQVTWDALAFDYPEEVAHGGIDYASYILQYITSLVQYMFPSWYPITNRAYAIWFERNMGYGLGAGSFLCPPCMSILQKAKIMRYIFSCPTDEALAKFIEKLLSGDAHEWEPDQSYESLEAI